MCVLHMYAITTLSNKVTLTLGLQGNIHCYIIRYVTIMPFLVN